MPYVTITTKLDEDDILAAAEFADHYVSLIRSTGADEGDVEFVVGLVFEDEDVPIIVTKEDAQYLADRYRDDAIEMRHAAQQIMVETIHEANASAAKYEQSAERIYGLLNGRIT